MELNDEVYSDILRIGELGKQALEEERFDDAIRHFQAGIDMLPEPKTYWEAAEWLYVYQGDAFYEIKNYLDARSCFQMAYNTSFDNPYTLMRLGECEFRLGDEKNAAQHLVGAFMLGGMELIENEPSEIIQFVRKHVD